MVNDKLKAGLTAALAVGSCVVCVDSVDNFSLQEPATPRPSKVSVDQARHDLFDTNTISFVVESRCYGRARRKMTSVSEGSGPSYIAKPSMIQWSIADGI